MRPVLTRWARRIAASALKGEIERLRPQLAQAAQRVYDEWDQDDEGVDMTYGGGGICDAVSQAMGAVIPYDTYEGGAEGDDHSWLVVVRGDEVVGVDIPPGVYETGGGYSWRKIEGVTIQPSDVVVWDLDVPAENFTQEGDW